jgi:hypothetical protein
MSAGITLTNATEVTSYQYLGMTKIAGALNMLPKKILRQFLQLDLVHLSHNFPDLCQLE